MKEVVRSLYVKRPIKVIKMVKIAEKFLKEFKWKYTARISIDIGCSGPFSVPR